MYSRSLHLQTRMMALMPNPNARYGSMYGAFRTIMATEHPRALFRGIGVVAMGAGPAHAIYFSAYEYAKKLFSRYSNGVIAQGEGSLLYTLSLFFIFLFPLPGAAGAVASLIHDGFMNPVEGD